MKSSITRYLIRLHCTTEKMSSEKEMQFACGITAYSGPSQVYCIKPKGKLHLKSTQMFNVWHKEIQVQVARIFVFQRQNLMKMLTSVVVEPINAVARLPHC